MMSLLTVKQDYINGRKKLWNKMHNTIDPIEYNRLAKQYNDLCQSYQEFLTDNNLSEEE